MLIIHLRQSDFERAGFARLAFDYVVTPRMIVLKCDLRQRLQPT